MSVFQTLPPQLFASLLIKEAHVTFRPSQWGWLAKAAADVFIQGFFSVRQILVDWGSVKSVCLSLKMQTPANPPRAGGGMLPWTGMPWQDEDDVELRSPNSSRVVGLPLHLAGSQGKQLLWPLLPTLWLSWCCQLGHVQDGTSQWQAGDFVDSSWHCTGDHSSAREIQK